MTKTFDPVAVEVFSNRLLSITEDMGNTLIRSSFSTNIKERRDCSVGLFDGAGRLIAQASHVPLHLGSLMGGVQAVLDVYSTEDMAAGDAFICNDPYLAGGTHMPDISIVSPVVIDGAVRFFTANIAHHSDVGGAVPGSISGSARTVFEEGIRIPAIRVARGGTVDDDVMRLVCSNTREPGERALDLRVQVATNARGAELLEELVERSGLQPVLTAVDDLLAYTERRLRTRIAQLKDGAYDCTSYLDDDGQGGDPVPIKVTARVAGDSLTLDFAGTSPQARGAMNVPESALRATAYYSVKTLLDPNLPPNGGMFDAIEITAPEGCLVNPRHPAAVGARSITCNKVARAIFGAFAPLLPDEAVMAAGHDSIPAIVFSGERRADAGPFVYLETVGGGSGARAEGDGMDAVHVHLTNTSNLPAEALEHEYPLLVDEYALVPDSGGAGTQRGGVGIARQISAMQDGIIFSIRSDSHVIGAPGVFGGGEGGTADLIRNADGPDRQSLSSKVSYIELAEGESMRLETAGGGGYGAPAKRAADALGLDLRDGLVSQEAAERDYGADLVGRALDETEGERGMTDSLIKLDFDDRGEAGRVAWVTFNNPAKRNALGLAGKERFVDVMTGLKHDESLRAVVLTGAGDKSFVGGTNIAEMAEFDLAKAESSCTWTHRVCDAVRQFPVPVIARINGYCFGSGMEIAACADMRAAADHAKFGMPETRFGIPSGMEASVLPRLIGWGKACELVLTGDHIDAEEAYRIGYLERLVPMAELDDAVERWVESLLACGPRAVRIQKRLISDWDRMSPTDGARAGMQAYVDAYRTDEPKRMMTAFVNRKR